MGIIYLVTNKVNGKQYVGQTVRGLEKRKQQHLNDAKVEKDDLHFHRAIRKYGEDAFEWNVIDECEDKQRLNELEIYYIQEYDTFKSNGYNSTPGGNRYSGENHPWYGGHHTEETKTKLSENKMGKKNPMWGKFGKDNPMYGRNHTEDAKQRMREAHTGMKHTEESKRKMSKNNGKAHRGLGLFGFTGGWYGQKDRKPWLKVWVAQIKYNGNRRFLGCYHDPLSCQIVHDLVWNEIYNI